MGFSSELMMEMHAQRSDEQLAKQLGISYDELQELEHWIETDASSDGMVYGYVVYFAEDSPKDLLDKVIGLEDGSYVYLSPWNYGNEEYYEEYYEDELVASDQFFTFITEIENLRKLNDTTMLDENLGNIQKRLIFIGVFGTLETYLSSTFISNVLNNDQYLRNFIQSYPEFRQTRFDLRNIYRELDKLKETVKRTITDIIYHHFPKVREMFRATFKIEFPSLKPLMKSLPLRHDFVHRNGKNKDGLESTVTKEDIENLISVVVKFADEIEANLTKSSLQH